jgi:hypothetical protein
MMTTPSRSYCPTIHNETIIQLGNGCSRTISIRYKVTCGPQIVSGCCVGFYYLFLCPQMPFEETSKLSSLQERRSRYFVLINNRLAALDHPEYHLNINLIWLYAYVRMPNVHAVRPSSLLMTAAGNRIRVWACAHWNLGNRSGTHKEVLCEY